MTGLRAPVRAAALPRLEAGGSGAAGAAAILLPRPARRRATIGLLIATAMQAFDATIANVALPQLARSLGVGFDLAIWVMTSYLCASAVTTVMTGWLRRRHGARPVFAGAIGLFVLASMACAVSTSAVELIGFRLVQGAAAGIIQPLAQAILLDLHPKARARPHARDLGCDDHGRPDAGPAARRGDHRFFVVALDLCPERAVGRGRGGRAAANPVPIGPG